MDGISSDMGTLSNEACLRTLTTIAHVWAKLYISSARTYHPLKVSSVDWLLLLISTATKAPASTAAYGPNNSVPFIG